MKKMGFLVYLFLLFSACSNAGEKKVMIDDIVQVKMELMKGDSTNAENIQARRSTLIRYWRFLWRQGYDVTLFDSICFNVLNTPLGSPEMNAAVDVGYQTLNYIYDQNLRVEEKKGKKGNDTRDSKTNWPNYMGVNGDGFSPDIGPSEGKITWKFPKHHAWKSKPVIDSGKVYLTSPGIDVLGYCLDELTGKVLWKARQYGISAYDVLPAKMDPIISDEQVVFRNNWGRMGVFIYDKNGHKIHNDSAFKEDISGKAYVLHIRNEMYLADKTNGKIYSVYKTDDHLACEPVYENGFVYGLTKKGKLYKYDIKKHQLPVWVYELNEPVSGPLKVGNSQVYIGDRKGKLHAIDKDAGSLKWTFSESKHEVRSQQQFSKPVEHGNHLMVGTSQSEILKINIEDGALVWKFETDDWVRSSVSVIGDNVYAATLSGNLYALQDNGKSCKLLWKELINTHGFQADLVSNNDRLLLSGRDLILYSISFEGDLQWKHGIVDGDWVDGEYYMADWTPGLMTTPTVVDGIMYVGGSDHFVNAVDVETGKELWKFETKEITSVAPTVAFGKVFIGQITSNEFYALDAKTGALIWENDYFTQVWVSAAFNNNKIFIGDKKGYMHAVNPDNGEVLWSYFSGKDTPMEGKPVDLDNQVHGWPPGIHSNTVVDATSVYFGSWSGYYFSLDQETGALNWRVKTTTEDGKGLPDSSAPMLSGDYLYVQKRGELISAIHKDNGTIDWEWRAPDGYLQNATVAADGKRVYGSVVRDVVRIPYNATIVAFDNVEQGSKELWRYNGGGGLTAPVLTAGKLYTGSSSHTHLSCLNSETGEVIWKVHTGGELLENVPAIYGNQLFVHTKNGYVMAIE